MKTKQDAYLKNENLNLELLENGYVVVKLFNSKELNKIKNIYKKYTKNLGKDFLSGISYFPTNEFNPHIDKNVREEVFEIVKDKLEELFVNYEYLQTVFLNKKKKGGPMYWHTDPSYYNEGSHTRPIAIWTSITRTRRNNGNLVVVPKSHKLCFPYSPSPLTIKPYQEKIIDINRIIKEKSIPVNLKKGEVIIHDQGLLHCSQNYKSFFQDRLAFKILMVPENASPYLVSFYDESSNTISNYKVDRSQIELNTFGVFRSIAMSPDKFKPYTTFKVNANSEFLNAAEVERIMNERITSFKAHPSLVKAFSMIE